MSTITLKEPNVRAAFIGADKSGKALLKKLFEGQVNLSDKITDRIKTYEDACDSTGKKILKLSDFPQSNLQNFLFENYRAAVITEALNEGWTPNWTDHSEWKYTVALTNYKSGSGFSRSDYGLSLTYTHVGSRLCFKSEELAMYAGEQFREIYNSLLKF